MRTLAVYSDVLADQDKPTKVAPDLREIRDRVATMSDKQKFTEQHYKDCIALGRIKVLKKHINIDPCFRY